MIAGSNPARSTNFPYFKLKAPKLILLFHEKEWIRLILLERRAAVCLSAFFLLLVLASTAPTILPTASAIRCQTQITNVGYPAAVESNQNVEVQTNLMVSCTTSMIDIAGRVDLTDEASNKTLSIQGFHVGYVSEPLKSSNFTVTNAAQAPSGSTVWKLKVVILVFAGSQLIDTTGKSVEILVGGGTSELLILTLSAALVVVVIILVFVMVRRSRVKSRKRR